MLVRGRVGWRLVRDETVPNELLWQRRMLAAKRNMRLHGQLGGTRLLGPSTVRRPVLLKPRDLRQGALRLRGGESSPQPLHNYRLS